MCFTGLTIIKTFFFLTWHCNFFHSQTIFLAIFLAKYTDLIVIQAKYTDLIVIQAKYTDLIVIQAKYTDLIVIQAKVYRRTVSPIRRARGRMAPGFERAQQSSSTVPQ